MINPIDKILTEWAYRVHNGMPNPSNSYHVVQLEQYLNELRLPRRVVQKVLEKVRKYKDNAQNKALGRVGKPWGSDAKDVSDRGASDDGVSKEQPRKKPNPNNEMNDDAHREKVKASFAKQREKRRLEKEAMLKKYPENAAKINELYVKVDKVYEDIEAYLSEKDPVKRQELGEKIFKEHNIAVNKVVEGDSPGDDNIKFYHNDIYDNKDLKNELPPDLYAEIQKRWGKVVPGSKYGHALAMGLQKDGVRVKDPSDTASENYKKKAPILRENIEASHKKVETAEKQFGRNSQEAKEARRERAELKKELQALKNEVGSALVGNTRRTSKPEMGPARSEIKEDGSVDPTVQTVMGDPIFEGITRDENGNPNSMSGLFGPIDKDDNVVPNTPENSFIHFKYSVEKNNSLQATIEELERQHEMGVVGPEIVKSVKDHKARLEEIMAMVERGELKFPSEEASRLVGESYTKLFQELDEYESDDGIINSTQNGQPAGSMIANMAEQALYDTETAAGVECYLPSAGTFPGGDKVVVERDGTKVERVESVSVKVGDTGKFYGFPGETKQYQKYHPDKPEQRIKGEPSYRDRHRNNSGEPGFATGIDDRLLSEPKIFEKMLNESGMADAVKDPKKLQETLDTMSKCIAKATASEGSTTPKNKKAVQACVATANEVLSDPAVLDPEKLEELVGPNNAKLILGGGPDSALFLTNLMSFGAIIGTSNGLKGLKHNHMDMDTHEQHTEEGSTDLKDYNFNFRHGEASRNGGLIAGFYPEKPKPGDEQFVEAK